MIQWIFPLILIAAHCIQGLNFMRNNFSVDLVRLGENNLNSEPDCDDVSTQLSIHCSIHENKISDETQLNSHISSISKKGFLCGSCFERSSCRNNCSRKLFAWCHTTKRWYSFDTLSTVSQIYRLCESNLFADCSKLAK